MKTARPFTCDCPWLKCFLGNQSGWKPRECKAIIGRLKEQSRRRRQLLAMKLAKMDKE
jgi:hypothetical protein